MKVTQHTFSTQGTSVNKHRTRRRPPVGAALVGQQGPGTGNLPGPCPKKETTATAYIKNPYTIYRAQVVAAPARASR